MVPAVADTCFLIDWARYRRRDILTKLLGKIVVTRHILDEIKSDLTLEYISYLITNNYLTIYPITTPVERIVMELASYAIHDPRVPRVDEPELYALAIGVVLGIPVLTENKGALRLAELHPRLSNLKVLGALEILEKAIKEELITTNRCIEPFIEYTVDTKHYFSRKRLENTVNRLKREGYCS
ncbi:MAG: hypothetical protein J7K21_04345 [Desulfurococcales archaeon]|nr:hypothetical protein [Desulfurococcales archaeon]